MTKYPVVLDGIKSPKLNPRDRAVLLSAMNKFKNGTENYLVSMTYEKQTDADNRVAGVDYTPIAAPRYHIGTINRIERNKKTGEWYITLRDFTRDKVTESSIKPGYTSIKLAGITSFKKLEVRAWALGE